MDDQERQARIAELERRLAEARARLPRHSLRPAQMIEIEEMEEELERLRAEEVTTGRRATPPAGQDPGAPKHGRS
jgi:hypothetical protein